MNEQPCLIQVEPELTIAHASDARQAWLNALLNPHDAVHLDLSKVQEMDSAGVQLLLATLHSSRQEGVPLQLIAPSRIVREVLALYELTDLFESACAAARH